MKDKSVPKSKTRTFLLVAFDYKLLITRFLISNTFISNARLKLAKNHVKEHTEADLELFENYPHSSSTLSFKNSVYSKK